MALGSFGNFIDGVEAETLDPGGPGRFVVTVADLVFDSVHLKSSTNNAFEYAVASATPVPLPAAAWFLLSGIGALAAASRRRR